MDTANNPLLNEAISLHRKGQIAKAKQLYEQVLAQDPNDPDAKTLLSTVDARLGKFEGSLGDQQILRALKDVFQLKGMPESERAYFMASHSAVELMRRSHYMEYPRSIHLETIALCNATCTFCPYVDMERIGVRMSDETIQKVIGDLTEFPQHVQFNLSPFKISDPFLEKRLPAIVEEVQGRMPNANLWIATNGSALTERNARKFEAASQRPIPISISLNEHDPDTYKEVMGLPFDRTVANLRSLHDLCARGEFSHPVSIARVSSTPDQDKAFVDWVRQEFPDFGIMVKGAGNWIGNIASRTRDAVLPLGCPHWFEVSIMATGKLALCCMDALGEVELGNVHDASLLELYNAPAHRAFRAGMKTRRDGAPCATCTYPETRSTVIAPGAALPV